MKRNKKQVFLLFSSDVWKSRDSMKLVSVCLSEMKLKQAIIREIKEGTMTYGNRADTRTQAINRLRTDWKTKSRAEINNELIGGYYDYTYNGEQYQ